MSVKRKVVNFDPGSKERHVVVVVCPEEMNMPDYDWNLAEVRGGVRGMESLPVDGGRVNTSPKLDGRDSYIHRITQMLDASPEDSQHSADSRERWIEGLPNLCDEWDKQYTDELNYRRMNRGIR
jgi:hypothetical protein